MRWSGTKLTKSSETEESGFTGPGPSSIRQTFLMLQAYDNLCANSKCVFFLTALPISPDRKENGVQPNKVAKRANQLNVCYKQVFEQGEANCERNLETFLRCIETVANTTQVHRRPSPHTKNVRSCQSTLAPIWSIPPRPHQEVVCHPNIVSFADNWICCDQADSAWQTSAAGKKSFEDKPQWKEDLLHIEESVSIGFLFSCSCLRWLPGQEGTTRRSPEWKARSSNSKPNKQNIFLNIIFAKLSTRWSRATFLLRLTRPSWKPPGFPVRSRMWSSSSTTWPTTGGICY